MSYATWREWSAPSPEQLHSFVTGVVPTIKWLNPEIVWSIAAYNEQRRAKWSELLLSVKVNPDYYLWSYSPCAFPGIRRHGSGDVPVYKTAKLKRPDGTPPLMYDQPGCLRTDDNDYPYQLWRGTVDNNYRSAGPSPKNQGYHLADIFPHTGYELKQLYNATSSPATQVFSSWPDSLDYHHEVVGLFTSAANFCFIPSELMRPTDHNGPFKRLLFQKAVRLYQRDWCQLFPPGFVESLSKADLGDWDSENEDFKWDEFTGDTGYMAEFNSKRDAELGALVSIRRQSILLRPENFTPKTAGKKGKKPPTPLPEAIS